MRIKVIHEAGAQTVTDSVNAFLGQVEAARGKVLNVRVETEIFELAGNKWSMFTATIVYTEDTMVTPAQIKEMLSVPCPGHEWVNTMVDLEKMQRGFVCLNCGEKQK